LGQLQTDLKQYQEAGLQIVGISYDSVETLEKYTKRNEIGYLLLSDPGSKTIDAYGIRNMDVTAGSQSYGIPNPGTILIDQAGIIRAKLAEEGYKTRHTTEALLEAAKVFD
jgi:peroxiredoxin